MWTSPTSISSKQPLFFLIWFWQSAASVFASCQCHHNCNLPKNRHNNQFPVVGILKPLCQSESAQIHNLYHQFFVCIRILAVCKLSVCASRQRTENYSKTFSSGFLHQTESLSLLSYIKPPCFWNKIILWKTSFIHCFSSLIYPNPNTVQKIYGHIIILSLNPTAT